MRASVLGVFRVCSGTGSTSTSPWRKGLVLLRLTSRPRAEPSTMTRTLSPGSLRICLTLDTVPTVKRSFSPGSSTAKSR